MTLLLRIIKRDDKNIHHLVKILEKKFACSVTFTFLDEKHIRLEVRCLEDDTKVIEKALLKLER